MDFTQETIESSEYENNVNNKKHFARNGKKKKQIEIISETNFSPDYPRLVEPNWKKKKFKKYFRVIALSWHNALLYLIVGNLYFLKSLAICSYILKY